MKYAFGCTLLLMSVFCNSCEGQNKPNPPQNKIRQHRSGVSESQLKEAANSPVPMSMVRNVKQARNGDILIASYVGVYRYDGKSFTNITRTIEWPTFWDVVEDRSGNLWFASQDSGVYYLPAGQATFQLFTTRDGLGANSALHIYEERGGAIWFGSTRYDPSTKSFRNFTTKDGFPTNNIRLLLEDKTRKLWFGAQGEDLFVYDGTKYIVLRNEDGQAFNNVWSVIEDKKGNIWFGGSIIEKREGSTVILESGLWRYDPSAGLRADSNIITKVSQQGAYAIIQDKEGNIWTTGGGNSNGNVWAFSRYDAKSLYDKNPTVTEIMSIKEGALLGLVEANDGSIWIGAMGPGSKVYRYDGKTITDFKSNAGQK